MCNRAYARPATAILLLAATTAWSARALSAPASAAAAASPSVAAAPEAGTLEPIPSDAELEQSGAVIGAILVDNQNIFDPQDPREDHKIFRLANRLHIKTRAYVIRQQLLFRPGERFSRRLLEESARILRSDRYFYDAWIEPVRYHDGQVDVRITTRDVWTLNPGVSFGRSGGKNTSGFELEELNILGTGAQVSLSHKTSIDRTSDVVSAGDQHAFGTWTSGPVRATSWSVPACLRAAQSLFSTQTPTSWTTSPGACSAWISRSWRPTSANRCRSPRPLIPPR